MFCSTLRVFWLWPLFWKDRVLKSRCVAVLLSVCPSFSVFLFLPFPSARPIVRSVPGCTVCAWVFPGQKNQPASWIMRIWAYQRIPVYWDGKNFFHLDAALSQIGFKIILGRYNKKFMGKKKLSGSECTHFRWSLQAILSAELIAFLFFSLFLKTTFINPLL